VYRLILGCGGSRRWGGFSVFHPVTDDIYNRRLDVEIIMSRRLYAHHPAGRGSERAPADEESVTPPAKQKEKDHSSPRRLSFNSNSCKINLSLCVGVRGR